jgi:hypothetical protein
MGKGIVKLGEGNWAVKDGNLLAAKETNGRFKNAEFTVTRGTDATYVGRDGLIANETGDDTPRIDFTDNTDGHLLLEPQSTNLIPYSENFEGGSWENASIGTIPTLDGNYTAPDGTNTAYKISNANQDSFWYYPSVADSDYARTIWARTVSGTGTAQLLSHNSNTNNTFTLTETWQRFEINSTTSSTGETGFYAVDFRGSGTLTELLIWGAQVENLSYATSYIPTNGGQVTRDAETCTGAGEAIDFNSEEGVLYVEMAALVDDQTYRTISLNDGTNNECVRLRFNTSSNTINGLVRDGGSGIAQISYQVSDIKQFHKAAFKYKSGESQLWIDGEQRGVTNTDTFTLSPQTQLNFNQGTSSDIFYGKCKAIKVYKDASIDLATLTS